MIGFLQGTVISKQMESLQCVVKAGDVGYEMIVSRRLFDSLETETTSSLWVHTHVKEGVFALYGFASETEKKLFRVLLSVSGLGPKTALSLLSEHGPEHLVQLILNKKASDIAAAPGVGKKSADRIVMELLPKLEKLAWLQDVKGALLPSLPKQKSEAGTVQDDLSTALLNLGYLPAQVKPLVAQHFRDHDSEELGFEAHLRILLNTISGRGPGAAQGLDN